LIVLIFPNSKLLNRQLAIIAISDYCVEISVREI
jgi:hypothetical protein